MRIIDTNKVHSPQCPSVHRKNNKLWTMDYRLWTILLLCIVVTSCVQKSELDQAREYTRQSQAYYQRAITKYKDLIAQGRDLDRAYFELGLLYYQKAEYELASQYLSKTSVPEAKKYRALALYKANDFTEARDAFTKIVNPDSQALYYHGQVCERLNLYDQALDIYRQINEEPYKSQAQNQIQLITRLGENLYLENLPASLQEIIKTAPSQDKYPNAGALILLCDEQIEITPHNTAVFSEYFVIKILNERGKQDFSEITIDYDSTYEKVEIEYAQTIRSDGVVIPVGSRHIRDVSKYLNFPLYSNARCRIISFPEISQGCIIEYKYKLYRNELLNKKDFVSGYYLQESEPIIQAQFRLITPQDKPLRYKLLNSHWNNFSANLEPVIKEYPNQREYLWEFKDIPAILPESNMPPVPEINPIILISTFTSWNEIYKWWWVLAKDKLQPDSAIKQQVSLLTTDKKTTLDKIRAIYNFCAENIRYVAVEYGQAGYEPHKAGDIFANKYGDCKDQTILLVTMLREIGCLAYPVLIGTRGYLNLEEGFPSLYFDHCIAAVQLEGDLIFLDPTCSVCSFGNLPRDDQARRVLIFRDSDYKIMDSPQLSPQENSLTQTLSMKINPDETIEAQRRVFTLGQYDQGQRYWLKYTPSELISETLQETIQRFASSAKLIKYEIENLDDLNNPLVLNYSFFGQEYADKAGSLRILPRLAALETSIVAKEQRRYPLDLGSPALNKFEFEIILPGNLKVSYLPKGMQKENQWLAINVEYELKGNHLYFKQITQIKKRYVALSEYPEFKRFLEGIFSMINERVVLVRGKI